MRQFYTLFTAVIHLLIAVDTICVQLWVLFHHINKWMTTKLLNCRSGKNNARTVLSLKISPTSSQKVQLDVGSEPTLRSAHITKRESTDSQKGASVQTDYPGPLWVNVTAIRLALSEQKLAVNSVCWIWSSGILAQTESDKWALCARSQVCQKSDCLHKRCSHESSNLNEANQMSEMRSTISRSTWKLINSWEFIANSTDWLW